MSPSFSAYSFLLMMCLPFVMFAQEKEWKGKQIPKSVSLFHYKEGQLYANPEANYIAYYNDKGLLHQVVRFDADSTSSDSTVYFSNGRLHKKYQWTYDGVIETEYYSNGNLKHKKIVDKESGDLLDIIEFTDTGLLLNDNDLRTYAYDEYERLVRSVENNGFYDVVKEYGFNEAGRRASVYTYHVIHQPAEVIFIGDADAGTIGNGMENPYLNPVERVGVFDYSTTNIDRSDIGLLDQRPPSTLDEMRFIASTKDFVEEKEDFFLTKSGSVRKMKKVLTTFNQQGLPLQMLEEGRNWKRASYSYEFDEYGNLKKQTSLEKEMSGYITSYKYKGIRVGKITRVRPDSSVIFSETITYADGGEEKITNHYEPHQSLKYTKVERRKKDGTRKVEYFDSRGKKMEAPVSTKTTFPTDTIYDSRGRINSILPKGYLDKPLKKVAEFNGRDTLYSVLYRDGEKIGINNKIYGEYGQLFQDLILYPNGKVEGIRYDTTLYHGKLVKRTLKKFGEETYCQKFAYSKDGQLAAVFTYPEGEQKLIDKEIIEYGENDDTLSLKSVTEKDTIAIRYFYERDGRERMLRWGKTIEVNGIQDTLISTVNFYKGKKRKQKILKGRPVFKAHVDTIYLEWDENKVLRSEVVKNQEGQLIKMEKFHPTGWPEKTIDQYGYEKYYFSDGSLKGHGRSGKFTEMFDEEGRLLYQRRSNSSIVYYKYEYRDKPLLGYDYYELTDSVNMNSFATFLDSSFFSLPDKNSDHYVVTQLSDDEFLFENRKDEAQFLFKSAPDQQFPKRFGLFTLQNKIRYIDIKDDADNWIRRKVLGGVTNDEYYVRKIEYWETP